MTNRNVPYIVKCHHSCDAEMVTVRWRPAMTRRNSILGLLFGMLLSFSVSCVDTEPGAHVRREGPIEGITLDKDGPEEVVKALGQPAAKARGWWQDEHRFD